MLGAFLMILCGGKRGGGASLAAPSITYAGITLIGGQWEVDLGAISEAVTNTGGEADSYAVQSGALPTGLTLNTSTGLISGTTTEAEEEGAFTIRATNATGTDDYVVAEFIVGS